MDDAKKPDQRDGDERRQADDPAYDGPERRINPRRTKDKTAPNKPR